MTAVLRSLRITPYTSSQLDRQTGERGEIFYESTNQTLRIFNGTLRGGTTLATEGFVNTAITATQTWVNAQGFLKVDDDSSYATQTYVSNAISGIPPAPSTSGTSILSGNGLGGFSNVTIGTGLSFSNGTLAASTSAAKGIAFARFFS